jgi:glycosyltransferase involved in cell wall biosynthesis
MSSSDVLIVVGPEDEARLRAIAEGLAPRLDYRLVAAQCGAEIQQCSPSPAALCGRKASRLIRSLFANLEMATQFVKRIPENGVVFSTGETWGLPIAVASALSRHAPFRHLVYGHRIYSPLWLSLIHCLRALLYIHSWICVTKHQAGLLARALGPTGAQVNVVSQGVDTEFFRPSRARGDIRGFPYLLSVGTEMRDYGLLFDAVRGLNFRVVAKVSSTWMAGTRTRLPPAPSNVRLLDTRLSYPELRDLYMGAALVVLPLHDSPQAAGITTILEAMAMRKPVLATESKGLPEVLQDQVTGMVCESTPHELGQMIVSLLDSPGTAARIAQRGHDVVGEEYSLEVYSRKVSALIQDHPIGST